MLVTQSCPTLDQPMDCSPPGSSDHGILRARILEWVAISFSRGIFPTQGSNLGLLYSWQILYYLNYQGSLRGWKQGANLEARTIIQTREEDGLGHGGVREVAEK